MLHRTISTTHHDLNTVSDSNLSNYSHHITQICLNWNWLQMSSDGKKETVLLPQREKRRCAEEGRSVALCCLDACARLPPVRCSRHCGLAFQRRKPLPATEHSRRNVLHLIYSSVLSSLGPSAVLWVAGNERRRYCQRMQHGFKEARNLKLPEVYHSFKIILYH